ncbi:hypothetical protein E2562_036406 [Oryza meyeriana var. granulata]|uniref:AMP-dependent synthetase/ligase domain-containing protein n=1 Tax=Oryza meyeriana var. granulata TaxID=110450 RepID=A0A6G1E9T0_9ORYZ|nr:hypothetical protein E2562_036406 [Oryza meyeriana var. granulata]
MEEQRFLVIHSYGLTETYGPATGCMWKPEWDALPAEERAPIKSRQGLHHLGLEVDVKDLATMRSVPADGRTVGEVMFRGNTVMSGYYKDGAATAVGMAGGWFRSGENISTIEVEAALFSHPAVEEAAVVGRPDEYWGETPCAFVKLRAGGGGGGDGGGADGVLPRAAAAVHGAADGGGGGRAAQDGDGEGAEVGAAGAGQGHGQPPRRLFSKRELAGTAAGRSKL